MNKDKKIDFRLYEMDFEYLRREAEKQKITISELLRRRIENWRKEVLCK